MSRFSPALANALQSAGWSEGRSAAELVARWKQSQATFAMSSGVEKVLLEFGGVRGAHPAIAGTSEIGYRERQSEQDFVIDPDTCKIDKATFQSIAQAAGESGVFPFGSMCSGGVSLVIGDSGAIYAFGGHAHSCVGKNIEEALAKIVSGETGTPLA